MFALGNQALLALYNKWEEAVCCTHAEQCRYTNPGTNSVSQLEPEFWSLGAFGERLQGNDFFSFHGHGDVLIHSGSVTALGNFPFSATTTKKHLY